MSSSIKCVERRQERDGFLGMDFILGFDLVFGLEGRDFRCLVLDLHLSFGVGRVGRDKVFYV
jgi:hypothetical protein